MKLIVTLAALVMFAASAQAQTADEKIAALQAQIDSIKTAAEYDSLRAVTYAKVSAALDSTTAAFGVSVVSDTDPQWIQIDFPLASSTGIKKAFVAGMIQEAKDNVGAQDAGVGRLRMRYDNGVVILQNIATLLALQ